MITVYYIIIPVPFWKCKVKVQYTCKMASKEGATEHGSGAGHTEYKASALEITIIQPVGRQSKACPVPYPKQARSEKVRVVYCYSYNVRTI